MTTETQPPEKILPVETPPTPIEEQLADIREKLNILVKEHEMSTSPWISGDVAAAQWAGYKCRKAFRSAMRRLGVKPNIEGKFNLWEKHKIVKAREKNRIY